MPIIIRKRKRRESLSGALTALQASQYLGCAQSSIYYLVKTRRLKAWRNPSGRLLLRRENVERFKKENPGFASLAQSPEPGMVSVNEAARVLGRSCRNVYRLIESDKIQARREANGRIWLSLADVEALKSELAMENNNDK